MNLKRFNSSKIDLKNAYKLLNLTENATNEEIKRSFFELARKFHPDSIQNQGKSDDFIRIRNAYCLIVRSSQVKIEEEKETATFSDEIIGDIKHKPAQHRQYLEYGGIGRGNPYQRQKQYINHRALQALENVHEYLLDKTKYDKENEMATTSLQVTKEQEHYAKKQKTTNAIERMVEDMIVESMKRGDFNNLKGMGKPLAEQESNPYIDNVEFKINQILINNGFAPPWIMKNAEIQENIKLFRSKIRMEYAKYVVSRDGVSLTSNVLAQSKWNNITKEMEETVNAINKAVKDYNLLTPSVYRQLFTLSFVQEMNKAVADVQSENFNSKWIVKAREMLVKSTEKPDSKSGFFANIVQKFRMQ
ncbi:unnamed protein product [Dracunculus medinensis]|uniref:J domain-containing protein n=1 Tax=Dracunculus medinensis TaxID=318479 RepID=A0A0N4U6J1_DRAME|nr:unnamed protein product [Dracunculus medinensis]